MEIEVAISKISKMGNSESGDTIEIVERPNGGLSIVMAEVLSQVMDKKATSAAIVRKVVAWVGEGIRDGAAARAASDFLYTEHKGLLSACLNIISFDRQSDTIVVTRNTPTPVFIYQDAELNSLSGHSQCIGNSMNIRPVISEIPLEPNTLLVLYSSGVEHSGKTMSWILISACCFDRSWKIRNLQQMKLRTRCFLILFVWIRTAQRKICLSLLRGLRIMRNQEFEK